MLQTRYVASFLFFWATCFCPMRLHAQFTVKAQIAFDESDSRQKHREGSEAVMWLVPLDDQAKTRTVQEGTTKEHFRLEQRNHSFEPHLLVVPVGARIDFPNHDYIFHNVFSLFDGRRFDLGLYEAGTSKQIKFDRVGISYIFCNIHPEMSAIVISLDTPFYGIMDDHGNVAVSGVPAGRYRVMWWAEGASDDTRKTLSREIAVSQDITLAPLPIKVSPAVDLTHLNKYGLPYDPANASRYGR